MKDAVDTPPVALSVQEAIKTRRSIRAFLPRRVEPQILEEILRLAGTAPSGANIQPWQVHVVSGAARDRLSARLLAAHESGQPAAREYNYYPVTWRSPYIDRRHATGWGLYGLLGIQKGDHEATARQHGRNYVFFDAPVVLVCTIDSDLQAGSWLDYGMFMQNIMIAARGFGLHTCPQAALASYPDIVKQELNIGQDKTVICGIALGYADLSQRVNAFQPERIALADFVQYHSD